MPAPTYNQRYTAIFENEAGNTIEVWILKKDYVGDSESLLLEGQGIKISWLNNSEDKLTPIRGSECIIYLWLETSGPAIDLTTFIGEDNEWKVMVWHHANMSRPYWEGFLVQEETMMPLYDKPFAFELRATDGLGRLKDQQLRRHDDTEFEGKFTVLYFIGNILWKLNPTLEIWSHFNVYADGMIDRNTDLTADSLDQIKLDARTFLKSGGSWDDEYTVLEKICKAFGAVLYQHHGTWHIQDTLNYLAGVSNYTMYAFDLTDPSLYDIVTVGGVRNKSFVARIAPANSTGYTGTIFPTLEDQREGLKFASKSVKLIYYYTTADLPKNRSFRSGVLFVDAPPNKDYDIDDWEFGQVIGIGPSNPNPLLGVTTAPHYRRSVHDAFGYETEYYVVIGSNSGERIWLRSEGIPVEVGDKVSISFGVRGNGSGTITTYNAAAVYLYTPIGGRFSMNNNGNWGGFGIQMLSADFAGANKTDWKQVSVMESDPIPAAGTLHIAFEANDQLLGTQVHIRDFEFSYMPYVAGSYRQTKGDYNFVSQNILQKKKEEEEVFISDGIRKVFRGAMFKANGTDLIPPKWYVDTATGENQRFSEMQAIKRWRHVRRNMLKVTGTFESLFYYDTAVGTVQHIGLINLFQLEQRADAKNYMLTNFEVDLNTEQWEGLMIQAGEGNDYAALPDTKEYNFIFE